MKDKKRKRETRRQQARMGSSYMAAHHVLSGGSDEEGRLTRTVSAVLALASAWRGRRWEWVDDRRAGTRRQENNEAKRQELFAVLDGLPLEELRAVMRLMYGGRAVVEGCDPKEVDLRRIPAGVTVREGMIVSLMTKAPLVDYLERGLDVAEKTGVLLRDLTEAAPSIPFVSVAEEPGTR